jgi:cytochrome c biogenesis protein CcdA
VVTLALIGQDADPVGEAPRRRNLTPYAVVAGLALSFSVFTLLGTLLLALPVPQDLIRWLGLAALVLLGLAMIVPALGAVYVPCAGPVLAAIAVAGATGRIGRDTIVLTVAFAIGTSIPLLVLALAGQRIGERTRAFREHQRVVRAAAGVVVLGLAVALTFSLTDVIQRAVPDYTAALGQPRRWHRRLA